MGEGRSGETVTTGTSENLTVQATVATMNRPPELSSPRAELRLAGVFESREASNWLKLVFLAVGLTASLVALWYFGPWASLVCIPVAAVFTTAIAMFGHEGSHKSFSANPKRNVLIQFLTFPLFSGLGALYWREKHDRLHHGHPNVENVDPDIRPFPFASTKKGHDDSSAAEKWIQRTFQSWAFWPATTLLSLGMRKASLVHLFKIHPQKHGYDKMWWADLGCQIVHYTVGIVLPSIVFGPLVGFALYSSIWAISGVFLALIFLPAHVGLPILNEQNHDWMHQVDTTRDLAMPKFVSYFFIGLDYQVEHHLFPKITHLNLPRAQEITAAWCKKHGVPYKQEPYLDALVDSARFMATAWQRDAVSPMAVRAGLVGEEPVLEGTPVGEAA